MKTAIVHDYLVQSGGAERVAALLYDLYPGSKVYTSIYDKRATLPAFRSMDVQTSFLQRWPLSCPSVHKLALPLYPMAFEQFDMRGYDLVLSSSSSFAKGVITPPQTCHICYCHTPARFAWRYHEYRERYRAIDRAGLLTRLLLSRLREWDIHSAQRVDYFVANSLNVARRIRKYYRRDSAVIYPPIETAKFTPAPPDQIGDHFLAVSRLLGYKRIDLAIQACNRIGAKLRVIGIGPEIRALRRLAGPTIEFLGWQPDYRVAGEYARCRALIFPGEEDFGMTAIEAMASGRPVVAFAGGGALETVVEGQTGLFFHEQTVDCLAAALRLVSEMSFSASALQAHALRFDVAFFNDQMTSFVNKALTKHLQEYGPRLYEPSRHGKGSFEEPGSVGALCSIDQ